ncbi:MAG: DUF2802 domain-containing protein [Syntrophales bacterium]|nr:DUF2802 domain-containing protein [Syntrophales bacterium]
MTAQNILLIQLAIEVLLLVALVALIWQVQRRDKQTSRQPNKEEIGELKRLIDESSRLSAQFVEALDEGRKILKSLAYSLEERERRLRELLAETEKRLGEIREEKKSTESDKGLSYTEAAGLLDQGLSPTEIAARLNLTTGEIELIRKLKGLKGRVSP